MYIKPIEQQSTPLQKRSNPFNNNHQKIIEENNDAVIVASIESELNQDSSKKHTFEQQCDQKKDGHSEEEPTSINVLV